MIRRIDLRDRGALEMFDARTALPRADFDIESATAAAGEICEDVRARGVEAIREHSTAHDGAAPESIRVPGAAIAEALDQLDPIARSGLEESIRRLRIVSANERDRRVVTDFGGGARVIQRPVPLQRVGIYVAGGLAPLVTSVPMGVVPAQVAGVESIAVASPPLPEHGGAPHPMVLAACAVLGIDEVYAVGGAQAMAMFAYGVEQCPRVDLIAGRGNVYTMAAAQLLSRLVGTHIERRHTEIAILAERWSDPAYIAADFIGQAERDPRAAAVLVTHSDWFADDVEADIERQLQSRANVDRIRASLTGSQSAVVLVDDMEDGLRVVEDYAPEQLEIHSVYAWSVANRVRNVGAIFVGPFSPVAAGDHGAGSNAVVPTGGWARRSSGLSVRTFIRTVQMVDYTRDALEVLADQMIGMAELEDLQSQGAAIAVRYEAARNHARAAAG